ncbi:MAG: hypothetical protein LBQ79_01340 [Deltaproteobacteria bacterium]|jgi:hypothetical protein|nr:hypothetical protein [Deltaproteobacteria bacterium]
MSDIRTVIFTADAVDRAGSAWAAASRGTVFPNFTFGELPRDHAAGGIPAASGAADALGLIEAGALLVNVASGPEGLDGAVAALEDGSPLRTVFALAAPDTLAFWGHGIAEGVAGKASAAHTDVLPTLAMVGEFLLSKAVEGRVLFEALRNPSYKQGQIGRLKAALARLEKVMKRSSQEPWDKHDCA